MIRANLRDGRTLSFDLLTEEGAAEWQRNQSNPAFQAVVTGLSVVWERELYTLPLPRAYRKISYTAETLKDRDGSVNGIRISVLADDTQASMTLYFQSNPKLTRYDLRRIGKPRFLESGRALSPHTEE